MRPSLSLFLCLGLSVIGCDGGDEGSTTDNAESMGMEESDESSTLGTSDTNDTNDSMATETGEDATTGAPGAQDVCCSCVEGLPVSCEPWSDGDECEGVVIEDCVFVDGSFDCGEASCS